MEKYYFATLKCRLSTQGIRKWLHKYKFRNIFQYSEYHNYQYDHK